MRWCKLRELNIWDELLIIRRGDRKEAYLVDERGYPFKRRLNFPCPRIVYRLSETRPLAPRSVFLTERRIDMDDVSWIPVPFRELEKFHGCFDVSLIADGHRFEVRYRRRMCPYRRKPFLGGIVEQVCSFIAAEGSQRFHLAY